MKKSILLQEEEQKRKERALHSEEILAQREKEFERRMLEMKLREEQLLKREQSLNERESSLLLSKNSFQRSYEGLKDIETPVKIQEKENEVLAELKSVAMKGNSTMAEKKPQAAAAVPLITESLTPFPKFSSFSGEDPAPKHEVAFEEWKFEINCARRNNTYSDQVITQAILKSLRPPAKKVLLTMDQSATVDIILQTLEGVFGNVSTGISTMQDFYTATQKPEESVANWGLRLEGIMQKAIDKGYAKQEEKNDLLKEQFWRSLKREKLKNATRVHYNTISSFELLRREVRAEENEMKKTAGAQHQPIKVGNQGAGDMESSKLDTVIQRLNSIEKIVKYGKGRGGIRWNQDYQENSKDKDQRKYEKNQSTENTDKKSAFNAGLAEGNYSNESPNEHKTFTKLVGKQNVATISVCGVVSQALLDSGSQVTTIAESYYHSALSELPLGSMDDFGLTLYGPDGREIPYLGYVWAEFSAPFMGSKTVEVPALVVPTTEYNLKVPVLIGTNVLNKCQDQAKNNGVPEEWKTAFLWLQNGLVGPFYFIYSHNIF